MSARGSPPTIRGNAPPLIDGRPLDIGSIGRLRRRGQRLLVTDFEREEARLEHCLRSRPGVTRANTVAVTSPKGGVGKTTASFLVATLLVTHLKLRVVAVETTPDFGALARLAPLNRRSPSGGDQLLRDADRLRTAAEIGRYMTRMPSGLHVLAAPSDPAARLGPDAYGELVALLACVYEVVLLDLGAGGVGPLTRFAVERSDQAVMVTTPDWLTSNLVVDALAELPRHDRTTVVINQARPRSPELAHAEKRFAAESVHATVTLPYDEDFAAMLESGTYTLEAQETPTRVAIKRLGLAVAQRLV